MEPWHKVTRTDWVVQNLFRNRWTRAGSPAGPALYGRIDVAANLRTFYFNPEAARLTPDLLSIYEAKMCEAPMLTSVALLVGAEPRTRRLA